jgi:RNA-directed DNA polymerase
MMLGLIESLSVEFGLGPRDLMRIIATAPRRYKVYEIPKRHGGMRVIAQPSRELKALQRFVIKNTLSEFPVHQAAAAYVEDRNIRENAIEHVQSKVLLKLDFQDFFPSITVADWERYAKASSYEFQRGELSLYSRILFWGRRSHEPRCLSIGAPSSPLLSNILLFDVDTKLAAAAFPLPEGEGQG